MKLIWHNYLLSPMVPSYVPLHIGLFARAIRRHQGSGLGLSGENSTGAGVEQLVAFPNPERPTKSSLYPGRVTVVSRQGSHWAPPARRSPGTLGPGKWSVSRTPHPGPPSQVAPSREVRCQGGSFPEGCFSSWIFNTVFCLAFYQRYQEGLLTAYLSRGHSLSQCLPLPAPELLSFQTWG